MPTGTGKTSIIALWAWARLQGLKVPTRLAYVIDRRLVVDSITEFATQLAEAIPEAQRPYVVKLRGGLTPDDSWFRDPLRAAILVVKTPYFTKTDSEGRFKLENLPSGKFILKTWLGPTKVWSQEIELKPGERLKVKLSEPAAKP